MATHNIWVDQAQDGVNCLRVFDRDPGGDGNPSTTAYEKGTAERKHMNAGDSITWNSPAGTTLLVEFDGGSPFSGLQTRTGNPVTFTNAANAGAVSRYKYNLSLEVTPGGLVITEDPQIIIDTTFPPPAFVEEAIEELG